MQYRLIGGNFTVFEFLHRCKHVCCQTNIFQIAELIWTNQTCSKYSNIYRVIYPHKSILQPNYILICLPYFGASFFPHRQELIQQDLPVRQRLHLTVQLADVDWRLKQGCGDSIQLPEVDFWNLIFLFCFFCFFRKDVLMFCGVFSSVMLMLLIMFPCLFQMVDVGRSWSILFVGHVFASCHLDIAIIWGIYWD